MKIEFNGWDYEAIPTDQGTEEMCKKRDWVAQYLRPLMMSADRDITDVQYYLCDGMMELVVVYYDEHLYEAVNVCADSPRGIAYDVIRQIF